MKQALVEQRMYREQESSHLEWPDHALGQPEPAGHPAISDDMLGPTIRGCPSSGELENPLLSDQKAGYVY